MTELTGLTALVTGNRGHRVRTARLLAVEGATVIITGRSAARGAAAAAELGCGSSPPISPTWNP